MIQSERRSFHTLDGLRGVAALLVVTRHADLLGSGVSLPETYLAVDLFFLLSGFVIAFAYDSRLANRHFIGKFLAIRLVRLYPLYLLGLVLGVLHQVVSVVKHPEGWNAHNLAVNVVLGMFFASSLLDTPTWTLLPELIANMAYAICFRWLTRTALIILVTLGAVGVIACRVTYGTLDAGWSLHELPVIASRLTFSFFGGVLLFRSIGDRRRTHPILAILCVAVVAAALIATPPHNLKAIYELALILAVFPLALWAACRNEPGESTGNIFRFLGLISYAVYVLHQPAAVLAATILTHAAHLNLRRPIVADGALSVFIALLLIGTYLIDRYYDTPLRKFLSRRLRLKT